MDPAHEGMEVAAVLRSPKDLEGFKNTQGFWETPNQVLISPLSFGHADWTTRESYGRPAYWVDPEK